MHWAIVHIAPATIPDTYIVIVGLESFHVNASFHTQLRAEFGIGTENPSLVIIHTNEKNSSRSTMNEIDWVELSSCQHGIGYMRCPGYGHTVFIRIHAHAQIAAHPSFWTEWMHSGLEVFLSIFAFCETLVV